MIFKKTIEKASISVVLNISEGYGRGTKHY